MRRQRNNIAEAYQEWPSELGAPSVVKAQVITSKKSKRLEFNDDIVQNRAEKKNYTDLARKLFSHGNERVDTDAPELINNKRCTCKATCKGNPATKKCFNCVKFDKSGKGFYCDECFTERHPWYRAQHKWEAIEDAKDADQDFLRHLARNKLEEDMEELHLLLDQTRTFCEEAETLGDELQRDRGISKALTDIGMIDRSVCGMIEQVQQEFKTKYMTREEAIGKIQNVWKIRKARKTLRDMIRNIYQQFKDPVTGDYVYYNTRTGVTQHFKPLNLGSEDFVKRKTRILRAADMDDNTAALFIQRAFRSWRALEAIHEMVQNAFKKILDPNTNKFYYHNLRTGQVSWTKPKLLGSRDILTPRSKAEAKRTKRRKQRKGPLTEVIAATMIQRMFRAHEFRRHYRKLISSVYEKIWDAAKQLFYYHNTRTGVVSWQRPANVEDDQLLTPRSRKARIAQEKIDKRRRARTYPLTETDAANIIQCCVRAYRFRKYYRKLISSVYEKILDEARGQYYYFNTRTKTVTWTRPANVEDEHLMTPRTRKAKLAEEKRLARRRARDDGPLTESDAVVMIQNAIRSYRFRKYYRKLISSVYEKIWDESRKAFYYVNTRTKVVSWIRPANVEDEHLLTPRTRKEAIRAQQKEEMKRRRKLRGPMGQDEAAQRIAGLGRIRIARRRTRIQILNTYEKIQDPNTGKSYYYNKNSKNVSWTKPLLLGDADLEDLKEMVRSPKKRKRKLDDEAAAKVIQGMYRTARARRLLRQAVREVYRKVLDEASGRYFYFNQRTGESFWDKPLFLGTDDLECS